MFREFEVIVWTCFSTREKIQEIIADAEEEKLDEVKKGVLNHLINTAYYVKRQVTSDETFEAHRAFFNNQFTIFEGKHTDWLLLNEPDLSQITPQFVSDRF